LLLNWKWGEGVDSGQDTTAPRASGCIAEQAVMSCTERGNTGGRADLGDQLWKSDERAGYLKVISKDGN
jgi:hypothetical protein